MIPLATTTITVQTVTETEPGEGRTVATLASGVRAHIGTPSGSRNRQPGGGKSVVEYRLDCDPVDGIVDDPDGGVARTCLIVDENTNGTYEIAWAVLRRGHGLDHIEAGMTRATGMAA